MRLLREPYPSPCSLVFPQEMCIRDRDMVDLDMLGYIDHNITVNIIKDNNIVEKRTCLLYTSRCV